MELTQPVDWLNKELNGYMINAQFSLQNKLILTELMQGIESTFGDAVFVTPPDSLHITLMDWIAPLVDYDGQDKAELFIRVQHDYDSALLKIISDTKPITVHFKEIRVSPSTIFIVGEDDGEFRYIRDSFVGSVDLLPDTKLPPQIVHSSIARFTKPIDINAVKTYIENHDVDFTQQVDSFRLVHSRREPLLDFEVIKNYNLYIA